MGDVTARRFLPDRRGDRQNDTQQGDERHYLNKRQTFTWLLTHGGAPANGVSVMWPDSLRQIHAALRRSAGFD